ncbi:MAG: hypothetical protein ACRD8A_02340 [Candidatus Acidiferrales bacterium]
MKPESFIYFFWVLFGLIAVRLAYQVIKKRGFKAALFGAAIARTVGELDLGKTGPISTTLKIHCLESNAPGTPTVGIELVNRSVASYHMLPVRLTSQQASALKELLSQAVAESHPR